MLATRQNLLRHFWYPLMPVDGIGLLPRPFTLLGRELLLWRDAGGAVRASPEPAGIDERYGYVWLVLAEPLFPIPPLPPASDPAFRMISEFYEVWRCAGLRLMENEFDNAHVAFVHRATFGVIAEPEPPRSTISPTADGFEMRTVFNVRNNDLQLRNLRTAEDRIDRNIVMTWFMPFSRTLDIRYPSGLRHVIFTAATPIDDAHSQFVQFAMRNDSEAEASAAGVVAFDRQVTSEDRAVLETTDPDVPLDLRARNEVHMASDRPGLVMRRMLGAVLARRGEAEATGARAPACS